MYVSCNNIILSVVPGPMDFPPVTGPNFIVSLSPMMIRTFNITIETKN